MLLSSSSCIANFCSNKINAQRNISLGIYQREPYLLYRGIVIVTPQKTYLYLSNGCYIKEYDYLSILPPHRIRFLTSKTIGECHLY